MKGNAAKKATAANFQPKLNEIATHPMRLKIEISGKTPLTPNNSCSCFGSVDNLAMRVPEEFSSWS